MEKGAASKCNFMQPQDELYNITKLRYLSQANKQRARDGALGAPQQQLFQDQLTNITRLRYSTLKSGKQRKAEEEQDELNFQVKAPKGTRDFHPQQMAVRRKVIDTISEVFRRHGAVEIDTPAFELKDVLMGKYGEDSKLIYDLEDQGGERCSLRYDLTVPFARYMANNSNIKKIKRFHIGKVYRRDQPIMTKGRFRQFYQCDLDIAGKYDPMIPDAEVLAVMQEILEAVGITEFKVKVNHRKILEAMVETAGIDASKFKAICASVDKLDKEPWEKVKQELLNQRGISEQSANIIGRLVKFNGEPLETLEQLLKQNVLEGRGQKALEEMSLLFSYLKAFNRLGKVAFDLSLARGLDYYTGMIYEIVLVDKKYEVGSISGGGRYDELIGMFSSQQIPSVGGSIGIERIFSIIEEKYKGKVKTNECEVLVATAGPVKVEDKLRVLGMLWNAGIKAETLYVKGSNAKKQMQRAFDAEIPMILWVGETELASGKVKLKTLYKNTEQQIPLQNLGADLKKHIAQYNQDFAKGLVKFERPDNLKPTKDDD